MARTPKQLTIHFPPARQSLDTVREISFGTVFNLSGRAEYTYLKLRPVAVLLNSRLIQEVINRGDCICANLTTGNICILNGNHNVIKWKAEFKLKEIME